MHNTTIFGKFLAGTLLIAGGVICPNTGLVKRHISEPPHRNVDPLALVEDAPGAFRGNTFSRRWTSESVRRWNDEKGKCPTEECKQYVGLFDVLGWLHLMEVDLNLSTDLFSVVDGPLSGFYTIVTPRVNYNAISLLAVEKTKGWVGVQGMITPQIFRERMAWLFNYCAKANAGVLQGNTFPYDGCAVQHNILRHQYLIPRDKKNRTNYAKVKTQEFGITFFFEYDEQRREAAGELTIYLNNMHRRFLQVVDSFPISSETHSQRAMAAITATTALELLELPLFRYGACYFQDEMKQLSFVYSDEGILKAEYLGVEYPLLDTRQVISHVFKLDFELHPGGKIKTSQSGGLTNLLPVYNYSFVHKAHTGLTGRMIFTFKERNVSNPKEIYYISDVLLHSKYHRIQFASAHKLLSENNTVLQLLYNNNFVTKREIPKTLSYVEADQFAAFRSVLDNTVFTSSSITAKKEEMENLAIAITASIIGRDMLLIFGSLDQPFYIRLHGRINEDFIVPSVFQINPVVALTLKLSMKDVYNNPRFLKVGEDQYKIEFKKSKPNEVNNDIFYFKEISNANSKPVSHVDT